MIVGGESAEKRVVCSKTPSLLSLLLVAATAGPAVAVAVANADAALAIAVAVARRTGARAVMVAVGAAAAVGGRLRIARYMFKQSLYVSVRADL